MSLQEHITVVASRANNLTFGSTSYLSESTSTLDCKICLWVFENKSELDIHNCLEHMIINNIKHKGSMEDPSVIQE